MKKEEAKKQLENLQQEVDKLKKIINSPESITDRIQSLEDVFEVLREDINDYLLFPINTKNKRYRYLNACSLIPKIVEAYNEETVLDWSNDSIYKYLPYYQYSSGSGWSFAYGNHWFSCSNGSTCHHYKSSDLLKDACKKFNNIYIDYFSYQVNN